MTTLADFLLARIAEDEAVARAGAERYDAGDWTVGGHEDWPVLWGYLPVRESTDPGTIPPPLAAQVERWAPARVLAECAAKRAVVAWCCERERIWDGSLTADPSDPSNYVPGELTHRGDAPVLRMLALTYADHPRYRDEWRP